MIEDGTICSEIVFYRIETTENAVSLGLSQYTERGATYDLASNIFKPSQGSTTKQEKLMNPLSTLDGFSKNRVWLVFVAQVEADSHRLQHTCCARRVWPGVVERSSISEVGEDPEVRCEKPLG